jgi:hypothetical protein
MADVSAAAGMFKIGDWTVEPAANRLFREDKKVSFSVD